jgi:hypothetical protein
MGGRVETACRSISSRILVEPGAVSIDQFLFAAVVIIGRAVHISPWNSVARQGISREFRLGSAQEFVSCCR